MKVIISHDVDHLTVWEHRKDFFIPKSIVRSIIELFSGYISSSEIRCRLKNIIENKYQNLNELMRFDSDNKIPSTFFVGVASGNSLNYSLKDAEKWALRILEKGFDVGVHGISYDDFNNIRKEHATFQRLTGIKKLGIRMHNLNMSEATISYLNEANYIFDSSVVGMGSPVKVKELWLFPLHIMDTFIIEGHARWQRQNLNQSIATTKRILEEAFEKELSYFTILFHDIYFSDGFMTWKNWYTWLITYLHSNNLEFVSYRDAVNELEQELSNG